MEPQPWNHDANKVLETTEPWNHGVTKSWKKHGVSEVSESLKTMKSQSCGSIGLTLEGQNHGVVEFWAMNKGRGSTKRMTETWKHR